MQKFLFAVACFGLMILPAFAGDSAFTTYNVTDTDGSMDSGWVVSFPTGSSDYFNTRYDNLAGRPLAGVSVGSGDFGSGLSYPLAGVFAPNLGVDGTGNTPDLTSGTTTGPVPGGGAVYNFVYASLGGTVTGGATEHVVVQLPPGDSGLLGVGQDDSGGALNFSGWTLDGYASPANGTGAAFGLNANVDVCQEFTNNNGVLALFTDCGDDTGDFSTTTVGAGDDLGMAFFAPASGTLWMLFLSFVGLPVKALTGALPTFPDGTCGALRGCTSWPPGFGGFTFNFVAVSGLPGVKGTVGTSNEVTVVTEPDVPCTWGTRDDGTYEGGWVVSGVAGSSDYFNVNYNCLVPPGVANVLDYKLAVMDFGSTATAYPTTGVFDSNYGVDPSGLTPDLSAGFQVAPMTYPAGLFASTSGLMQVRTFTTPVAYGSFASDDVHGVVQFPPGDPGLLGVGGDTTVTGSNWYNGWTLDGYATPSNDFSGTAGWGMRLGSN
jgi:hypothetical protein